MDKPCKETFEYPSYKCYQDIKRQFVDKITKNEINIISYVREFEETYTHDKLQKLDKLPNVFTNLKKYLSNTHVFISGEYDGQGTCNYISYLLCDGISKKNGECDEETFNILKEFVDTYNEKKRSHMCINNIKHIVKEEFLKMKALYELYDKYKDLYIQRIHYKDDYCKDMVYLVGIYNKFLYNYESRAYQFNDVLKQFEKLMETITETGKTRCKDDHIYIRKPDLFKETVEQIQPPTNTLSSPETNPSHGGTLYSELNPKPQEVPNSSTTFVGEQQRAYLENFQRSEVAATSVRQEPVERRQSREHLEHSEKHVSLRPQQSYVSPGTYVSGKYYGHEGYREANETFLQGKDSITEKEQLGYGPGKENVGAITNIQSAFSGFMKDVDPIPVVGVSGGMGALFLLFRVFKVLKI
ncbi:hypothetical protein PVNG_06148 [Plasmodium vivax North Korean]|uniref:VIR protein n=1 Tax=Plasmodium vivax North Korean TaxID=1035514 RepID=A0A0J9TML1_PLAVI|nr:hypothetical protein PVNG_06148 [Plasmodium vivax North Korean]